MFIALGAVLLLAGGGTLITARVLIARYTSPVVDWMWALKNISPSEITMLKTAGTGKFAGSTYLGEQLLPDGEAVLAAVRDDTLDTFALEHPKQISTDGAPAAGGP